MFFDRISRLDPDSTPKQVEKLPGKIVLRNLAAGKLPNGFNPPRGKKFLVLSY
jgi:hypothetical protein